MSRRAAIIVLDGVGCGAAPDAAAYGDVGSNTLGNLSRAIGGLDLPHLTRAGLGNLIPLQGVPPTTTPTAATGVLVPKSPGKDSTTGHWEIAGVHLAKAFPTYPNGFPPAVLKVFSKRTGRAVIGNVAASGTGVIAQFGEEHQRTGAWIVYTSADSVFQIAAHEETVGLQELYRACEIARDILVAPHDASRVIARPFVGAPGNYQRTSHRRDFSIQPPETTLVDALAAAGVARHGVGKVDDLFAGRNLTARHSVDNAEGLKNILAWLRDGDGFLLANLVDFDQLFGHRNDISGFNLALRQFDAALPELVSAMKEEDLLFLTADHGNDPTTPSTDHARECVPMMAFGTRVRPVSIGRRDTFSDLGATVAEWMGLEFRGRGRSFLSAVVS